MKQKKMRRKKKSRFLRYFYSPDEPTPTAKGKAFLHDVAEAVQRDYQQTKNNISHTAPLVSQGVRKTGSFLRHEADYIRKTPKHLKENISARVNDNRQRFHDAQQPVSPEEYQRLVGDYEPPTPEYPTYHPETEEDLYRQRRQREPSMPEYADYVSDRGFEQYDEPAMPDYADDTAYTDDDAEDASQTEETYFRRKKKRRKTMPKKMKAKINKRVAKAGKKVRNAAPIQRKKKTTKKRLGEKKYYYEGPNRKVLGPKESRPSNDQLYRQQLDEFNIKDPYARHGGDYFRSSKKTKNVKKKTKTSAKKRKR